MNLASQLDQLEIEQLVRHLRDDEPTFAFRHTLTQETAYSSLLKNQRREIHRRVAQAIEEIYPDQLEENAARLAQHYAEAGDAAQAFDYSVRAGDIAARVYANTEAIMYYDRAIEIVRRNAEAVLVAQPSLADAYLKRGRAFEHCGQFTQAIADYQAMENFAQQHRNRSLQLAAMMARATLYATPTPLQNLDRGRNLLDDALALARELNDGAAESKVFWNLTLLEYFDGHHKQSVQFGEQALAIVRELGLPEQTAFVLNDLGRSYVVVGRRAEARAAQDEARTLWRSIGNLAMLADNLSSSADTASAFGEYAQALDYAQQAYAVSQSIGNLWNQAYSQLIMGLVYFEYGDSVLAVAAMRRAMELGDQVGFVIASWMSRTLLAWLYGLYGMPQQGIAWLESQLAAIHQENFLFTTWTSGTLGYLYLQLGDLTQAQRFIVQAQRDANWDDMAKMDPVILTATEGALAFAQQRYDQVEQITRRMLDVYARTHIHYFKSDVLFLRAQGFQAQGKIQEAHAVLLQARAETETMGVRRDFWRILALLADIELQLGNSTQASLLREQARENIAFLAERASQEFRETFLSKLDVQRIMAV